MILGGALLAGGKSARMGTPKAGVRRASDHKTLAEVALAALAAVTDDVVVLGHGAGCPDDVERLPDAVEGIGPLGGLLALLESGRADAYVIVPSDLPFLEGRALEKLVDGARGAAAAVLDRGDGRLEPFPLYLSSSCREVVERAIVSGERRLTAVLEALAPRRVAVPPAEARSLAGANTPAELVALEDERRARRVRVRRFIAAGSCDDEDALAEEEPLEVRVHGVAVAVLMRTPGHDHDLVTGFLVTERVIARFDDVVRVEHCATVVHPEAEENVVDVQLAAGVALDLERLRRNLYASSSCGVCGKATIENALAVAGPLDDDTRVSAALLYALPARLYESQPVFASTGGLHAAALFDADGCLLVVREDIGRHNAVDKVIGHAAREGTLGAARVLLVSGRVSFEIVQKAAAARVPVVVGLSAASSLAVRLGEALGVTVVAFLRGESCNVYSHAERVVSER